MTRLALFFLIALSSACSAADEVWLFSRADCPPCRAAKTALSADPSLLLGNSLSIIDVEAFPETAARFNVRSVPTFVLIRDGREVSRKTGWSGDAGFFAWLKGCTTRFIRKRGFGR